MSRDGEIAVEPMARDAWDAVAAIYAEGIRTGDATFETEVPSWEVFDERHLPDHRLVARDRGGVLGWAALSRASIEACGFRLVGRRERLGKLRGEWRDVLLLERRGPVR